MADIAVIVPVYKAEDCIHRCADSILAQTYTDFTLILVDDGSPDRSGVICDEYAQKDSRVHVIHQPNSGPSVARNSGIDWAFAHTDCAWLAFVDSDDCVHPQYLERLRSALREYGGQIAMCRHRYISLNDELEEPVQLEPLYARCLSAEELMIEEDNSFNYAWAKLFSAKCFENLRYPEDISFGEDNLILFRAMFGCERIVFMEDQLYYYFYNAAGITKSPWTPRSLQCFEGIKAQLEFYRINGYERSYHKEIELYIQQCAYQIHRIRENRADLQKNKPHLKMLTQQMQQLFRENADYHPKDKFFWYESLYPLRAKMWSLQKRLHHNLNSNGLTATLGKLLRKCMRKVIERGKRL